MCECLRRLGGNRPGEERGGRFFANTKVTAPKIAEGWSDRTGAAYAGRHVLAIADTTELHFPTHDASKRGFGKAGNGAIVSQTAASPSTAMVSGHTPRQPSAAAPMARPT